MSLLVRRTVAGRNSLTGFGLSLGCAENFGLGASSIKTQELGVGAA